MFQKLRISNVLLRTIPKSGDSTVLNTCWDAANAFMCLEYNSHPEPREMQGEMANRGGGAEMLDKNEEREALKGDQKPILSGFNMQECGCHIEEPSQLFQNITTSLILWKENQCGLQDAGQSHLDT